MDRRDKGHTATVKVGPYSTDRKERKKERRNVQIIMTDLIQTEKVNTI
jgi:hypothetical protein